jgi:flavin-dependent dehydrogenase
MVRPFSIATGGGLAGSAFALELARHGMRALIIESSRGPHDKVCGEFLSAETQTLLEYLGVKVGDMGATRISTLRLASGKRFAESPLPFRGAGLSRAVLDEALLSAALRAGAEVIRGRTVNGIDAGDCSVAVRAGNHTYTGDNAALATGKHGLRHFPRPRSDVVGFKLQLRLRPAALRLLQGTVQLAAFEGGYIGACAVENEMVPVCWVMKRELVKKIGSDWAAQSAFLAAQVDLLGDLLEGAKPTRERPIAIAQIPYGYLRREPISGRVFALGDQLAVIPSLTGDGMAIALYTGIAAAQAVLTGVSADEFQRRAVGVLRSQFRWASVANAVFETPMLHGLGLSIARMLPGMVALMARATRLDVSSSAFAGDIPLRDSSSQPNGRQDHVNI